MPKSTSHPRHTRSHGPVQPRGNSGRASRGAPVRNGRARSTRETSGRVVRLDERRGTSAQRTAPAQRTRPTSRTRPSGASGNSRLVDSRRSSKDHGRSQFDDAVATGWSVTVRAVKMAFTGDVPESVKGQRISSEQSNVRVKSRLVATLVVMGLLFTLVFSRVVWLQTVARDGYLAASIDQRTRPLVVKAERGVIFDRNGNELALSVPRTTVYVDPREVQDLPGTSRTLASLLQWTPEQESKFLARISEPGVKFSYVARQLRTEDARVLLDLGLPGIYSYTEPYREVESGVAGSVIGQTDPDGKGSSGLELQYDKVLNGRDGQVVKEVDSKGRSIAGSETTKVAPVAGDDMVLTIDKSIQFQVDQALLQRVAQLRAKGATAVVMDSRTGDIYAMSNVRRDKNGVPALARGNFAVVDAHEPGSVAKVFSISAALNEGVVGPDTVLSVPGSVTIGKYTIRDAWPHPTIDMDVRHIVSESSNIGTMLATEKVGPSRLHDYLTAFGFGTKTGLNYPQESRGILKKAKNWYGTERHTVTYGYGYAVTPLQMVAAVNTVANGGVHVAPRLVAGTIDRDGVRRDSPAAETRTVLSAETATAVTGLLKDVVCNGTGALAQVKGMQVAGKTGTGYKAQDNGTYVTDEGSRKYFSSFVGYFPADAPRVTVLVSIDEPSAESRDRFGGTAAAPVFAKLVPAVMHELGIPATGTGTGCKNTGARSGH